jgi:hypothetical protein
VVAEDTGAEINRLASELQVFVSGRGTTAGSAITVFATALANEAAAAVMRNPGLSMDEILDMTCETVRDMARYTAHPSSDAPKDPGDLTEQEFAQLTMRIIRTATNDTTATDAMAARRARAHRRKTGSASVPFPTFVSFAAPAFTNVGNKGTLASHDPSVALHLTFL